ncbi:MAG: hypothetical protein EHM81_00870 [Chloroflexi bacterium]|nr:MAG: hypothetical protein EHM81_00870 [Chloroflexota bacterium]
MRKISLVFLWMLILLALTACASKPKPACPPIKQITLAEIQKLSAPAAEAQPAQVKIGGRTTQVDRVVSGPLCNGQWRGIVYVGCDIQVVEWKDNPLFLKDCNLKVEPDTVVYVAYHNDTAYYKGCSCHTGEIAEP